MTMDFKAELQKLDQNADGKVNVTDAALLFDKATAQQRPSIVGGWASSPVARRSEARRNHRGAPPGWGGRGRGRRRRAPKA